MSATSTLRSALAALALLLGLWPQQAGAVISFTQIGNHTSTASSTTVLTVSATCATTNAVVVIITSTASATLSSVADSGGNTYQPVIDNISGTSVASAVGFAYNIGTQLTSATSTITATFSGSTTSELSAACVTGLATTNALDIHNKTNQGTSATAATSTSTGTLNHANELAFGILNNNVGRGTLTCGSGWTLAASMSSSATPSIGVCTDNVTVNTSLTFAPTWVTSSNYVLDIVTFADTPTGGTVTPKMGLMGVGP